jgi:hypothetical protein
MADEIIALSLFDYLIDKFGEERILLGGSNSLLSADFIVKIEENVAKCNILLALIGRDWAGMDYYVGPKKGLINAPNDRVRVEIETALKLNIRIIPLLYNDAVLPQTDDFPQSLHPLIQLQALTLRLDPDDTVHRIEPYAEHLVAPLQAALAGNSGSMVSEGPDVGRAAAVGPSTTPRGTRWLRGARAHEGRSVFISYRRKLSESLALLVHKDLTEHRYNVFMDFKNLDSGEFDQRILTEIQAREHFLVVLEPGSLDRINQEGDWLRREIAHALAHGRNVVPVTKRFELSDDLVLPRDVAGLRSKNAFPIPEGYFDEAMERLRTRFLKMPANP